MLCSKRSGKIHLLKRMEGGGRLNAESMSSVPSTATEAHTAGVQCKGKDANYGSEATRDEIMAEIAKAETFTPTLEHWIFATTAPVDGRLQEAARELSAQRKKQGLFVVDVLGWEEIQVLMAEHPEVIADFYPEHADHIPKVIEALTAPPSLNAKLASLMDNPGARSRLAAANRPSEGKWEAISFDTDRGLGPALVGRPLGLQIGPRPNFSSQMKASPSHR